MLIKLFVSTTVLAVGLVGGCDTGVRRADQGCPDEDVLAASGACCDPAFAVVVGGISDCANAPVVRPDAGTPDANDAGDAGDFVFPCKPDEFLRANGDCVQFSIGDGGLVDGGDTDGGACTTVISVNCPATQAYDPQTGLCVSTDAPDSGTPQCPDVKCPAGQIYDPAAQRCHDLAEACRFTCDAGQLLTDTCDCVDPTPACKTCVGALLDTTTNECVVAPVCPGPCPAGTARNNAGTCVTVSSTWTFPCNAGRGEVLKADGTCYVPSVPPGPCPSGQARDNAGTCVPVSTPWTFPCNPGESLSADGTTCLPPPPPAWNQTCAANQYLTPNGQQCVTPPAPWTFPCNAGLGEVLKADGTCYVPPVPPGPCPVNQARDNTGTCVVLNAAWTFPCASGQLLAQDGTTCVALPTAKVEASFQISPDLPTRTDVTPGQSNVTLGNITLRVAGSDLPAEVTAIPVLFWAADTASGPFSESLSAGARAQDRFRNCWLKDWPPLTGTFGPVNPGTDGRLLFTGTFAVNQLRSFSLVCDSANVAPNNGIDAFAADVVAQGGSAVSVNGSTRTALPYTIGPVNGNPPRTGLNVQCLYTVIRSTGTAYQVQTRPTFSLSPDSPRGTVARGWVEGIRIRVSVPACGDLRVRGFPFTVTATGSGASAWMSTIYGNQAVNLRITAGGVFSNVIGTVSGLSQNQGTMNEYLDFSGTNLAVVADSTQEFSVWVNGTTATAGTSFLIQPGDTAEWNGIINPSSYPPTSQAPDLAAMVGNLLTFQ